MQRPTAAVPPGSALSAWGEGGKGHFLQGGWWFSTSCLGVGLFAMEGGKSQLLRAGRSPVQAVEPYLRGPLPGRDVGCSFCASSCFPSGLGQEGMAGMPCMHSLCLQSQFLPRWFACSLSSHSRCRWEDDPLLRVAALFLHLAAPICRAAGLRAGRAAICSQPCAAQRQQRCAEGCAEPFLRAQGGGRRAQAGLGAALRSPFLHCSWCCPAM